MDRFKLQQEIQDIGKRYPTINTTGTLEETEKCLKELTDLYKAAFTHQLHKVIFEEAMNTLTHAITQVAIRLCELKEKK